MKYHLIILLFSASFHAFGTTVLPPTCDLIQEDLEGFTTNNPPTDWSINGGYIIAGGANLANSGTTRAGLNSVNDNIILAPLTCPGELCFFWRASGATSNYDVDVEWSQDNGANWNILQTITTNGNDSPLDYAEVCIDMPEEMYNAPFSDVLIRFYQSRRSGGSFYVDDICVSSGVCAAMPTQLTFQNTPTTCTVVQTPFSLTVCATDNIGTVDPSFVETITLTKDTGSGVLSGTLSAVAVNGCAEFTDLSFNLADTYTILANSPSFTGLSASIIIENVCTVTAFDTLKIMSYNVLNFPDGSNCGSNTVIPSRWDTLRKIVDYVEPDVLMVCELQTEVGADRILNDALNVNGRTTYQRADFVLNQSGGNSNLNNMFFYRSDKMTLSTQSEIQTNVRDIGQYTVFLTDPNLSTHEDTIFVDFYMAHLKAGDSASDADSRATACTTFQNYLNSQPSARNAIFGGDFNLYTSNESAYQLMLSGTYPFFDPVNTPGDWNNDFDFRAVHTQSVRSSSDPLALDCGARGGMDSRFDFLLATNPVMNGTQHIKYIPNTYEALGNSGNLFNDAINDPANNSGVPKTILESLYHMSDHLPIVMDLEVDFPVPTTLAADVLILNGKKKSQNIELSWQNYSAQTVSHWIIEKSSDGKIFEKIAQLDGQESFFEDVQPLEGMNYFRLKRVNTLGQEEISNVISVNWSGKQLRIFPNPAQDYIRLSEAAIIEGSVIDMYNIMGQQVGHFFIKQAEEPIFVGNLPTGVYYIKVEGLNEIGQFVKW